MVAHFRPGLTQAGTWRTAVAADGKGFPDLVLAHRDRGVMFVELKAEKGKLSAEQTAWGLRLAAAGATWHVWKPSDWPIIESTLKGTR
jgi:hypothetical protein